MTATVSSVRTQPGRPTTSWLVVGVVALIAAVALGVLVGRWTAPEAATSADTAVSTPDHPRGAAGSVDHHQTVEKVQPPVRPMVGSAYLCRMIDRLHMLPGRPVVCP